MKRRGFLGLLGIAPVAALAGKEAMKTPAKAEVPLPKETVFFPTEYDSGIWVTAGERCSLTAFWSGGVSL